MLSCAAATHGQFRLPNEWCRQGPQSPTCWCCCWLWSCWWRWLVGAGGSSGAGLARTIAWNQNKTHSQDKSHGQDRAVQDVAICTGLDKALGYCKCAYGMVQEYAPLALAYDIPIKRQVIVDHICTSAQRSQITHFDWILKGFAWTRILKVDPRCWSPVRVVDEPRWTEQLIHGSAASSCKARTSNPSRCRSLQCTLAGHEEWNGSSRPHQPLHT